MRRDRFHGRYEAQGQCAWPGCQEAGEFRAPGGRGNSFDGPGDWRWLCLDHVREFNAGYDFFEGMDSDEIFRAQSPLGGWERETRAFSATAAADAMPRWADFEDPLEAISARAQNIRHEAREAWAANDRAARAAAGPRMNYLERQALETLGLAADANRRALRERYAVLVRKYHPDRNGGDRSHEARLRAVVEAYQTLRKASAFS